jgi:hypothetical protein
LITHVPVEFSREEGRKFGLSVGPAFLALAALVWWRGEGSAWMVLGGIGGALFVAGLLIPGSLGPVYRGWMRFALILSKVTTPIFMGIIYFGLFLITGLLRRTIGSNQMVRTAQGGSYWVAREHTRADLERQF